MLKVTDVYRRLYPTRNALSRINTNHISGTRIDTIFSSDDIFQFADKVKYHDFAWSDHRIMYIYYTFNPNFVSVHSKLKQQRFKEFMNSDPIFSINIKNYLEFLSRQPDIYLLYYYQKYKAQLVKSVRLVHIRV